MEMLVIDSELCENEKDPEVRIVVNLASRRPAHDPVFSKPPLHCETISVQVY